VNFYGTKSAPEHTIAGRLIPLGEALVRAISKASNQPLAEPKHSAQLPAWCHNICDQFAKTIFRNLIKAAPQAEKLDVRNYGRM